MRTFKIIAFLFLCFCCLDGLYAQNMTANLVGTYRGHLMETYPSDPNNVQKTPVTLIVRRLSDNRLAIHDSDVNNPPLIVTVFQDEDPFTYERRFSINFVPQTFDGVRYEKDYQEMGDYPHFSANGRSLLLMFKVTSQGTTTHMTFRGSR
jgi:hypothetical protein